MRPLTNAIPKAGSAEHLQTEWQGFKMEHPREDSFIKYVEQDWINATALPKWVGDAREVQYIKHGNEHNAGLSQF